MNRNTPSAHEREEPDDDLFEIMPPMNTGDVLADDQHADEYERLEVRVSELKELLADAEPADRAGIESEITAVQGAMLDLDAAALKAAFMTPNPERADSKPPPRRP